MKLFKISQNVNTDYDTYSDAIVCAENKKEAQGIHPDGNLIYDDTNEQKSNYGTWCPKNDVKVEYIGIAKRGLKKGVVCASFHAG